MINILGETAIAVPRKTGGVDVNVVGGGQRRGASSDMESDPFGDDGVTEVEVVVGDDLW